MSDTLSGDIVDHFFRAMPIAQKIDLQPEQHHLSRWTFDTDLVDLPDAKHFAKRK